MAVLDKRVVEISLEHHLTFFSSKLFVQIMDVWKLEGSIDIYIPKIQLLFRALTFDILEMDRIVAASVQYSSTKIITCPSQYRFITLDRSLETYTLFWTLKSSKET